MPKRLSDAELDAALAAGEPPRSDQHDDDEVWHAEQQRWLSSWQPERAVLPSPQDRQRRKEWDKLTKQHARALQAAKERQQRPPPLPPPAPKKRGAPRVLSDG